MFFLLLILSGPSPALLIERAAALRDRPQEARPLFRAAAAAYEQQRRSGFSSARFFLAQGNANLLADDLPAAILAYRRGLRLRPNDRTLQTQLAFARDKVVYGRPGRFARPEAENRPPVLPRLPIALFVVVAWLLVLSGCLEGTRWLVTRQGRGRTLAVLAFAAALAFVAGAAWEENNFRYDETYPLVVIAQDGVLLRIGNGEAYPRRVEAPLNRGVEARRLFARGAWVQIELGSGEVGWVPTEYALVDVPGAS